MSKTAGPANRIALAEPKNNPVPIAPPSAIIWIFRFVKAFFIVVRSILLTFSLFFVQFVSYFLLP